MKDQINFLIWLGLSNLEKVTGTKIKLPFDNTDWKDIANLYNKALSSSPMEREKWLTPILSKISLDPSSPPLQFDYYFSPSQLNIDASLFPRKSDLPKVDWIDYLGKCQNELSLLLEGRITNLNSKDLERFYYFYYRWTWSLPCTYGEQGVSLFEEWRTLSAMVFATGENWSKGPADEFLLIGGDIPGIQDFVYTITSRGAAKSLRGRSFFLQLAGDAIIRRILREFNLTPANVVYAAGGNFMILGQAGLESRLQALRAQFETALLEQFSGDLAICLAWSPLSKTDIGCGKFSDVSRLLKDRIAEEKSHRFHSLLGKRWSELFEPHDAWNNQVCVVCQQALTEDEARVGVCKSCSGFRQLAEATGHKNLILSIQHLEQVDNTCHEWQKSLHRLGGEIYSFSTTRAKQPAEADHYLINATDFISARAQGFRWLANITPRIDDTDIDRQNAKHGIDREVADEDEKVERIERGMIRSLNMIADRARGIKKIGVLRMDVDDLGAMMARGLSARTMAATSAFSASLERFFGGYLNHICENVNQEFFPDRGERLYTIYAGGDDLFIIGAWDLMPELATRIRNDFHAFTGENSQIHLSAGITLEDRKFPFYQAAERAGEAEHIAKQHARNGIQKNSICFLNMPIKWEDWHLVTEYFSILKEKLLDTGKVPKALIQNILNIYDEFQNQQKQTLEKSKVLEEPDYIPIYGSWIWHEAYSLRRMANSLQKEPKIKEEIEGLQVASTNPIYIRHLALAARWVDLITRKEED
jgi:CRISPR-associated protein Csm1